MKEFTPDLKDGTPRLRVGRQVPPEGVNLSFIHSPPVTADKIQVLDLSRRIAENTALQHPLQLDMFADQQGILRDEQEKSIIPLDNVLVTNEYKDGEPLFWRAVSRHYHYEKGIIEGEYRGERIRITKDGEEIEEGYVVQLKMTPAPDVYRIHVLSSFLPREGENFYLHYHRSNNNGSSIQADHREILNLQSIYLQVERDVVEASPLGEKLYSVDLDLDESGFEIRVPEQSTLIERSPAWVRWRAVRSDGKSTPWRTDLLYKPESLHPEEIEQDGQVNYIIEDGLAYKILHHSPASLLGETPTSLQTQFWNGFSWESSSSAIAVRYGPGGRLEVALADPNISTGTASSTEASRSMVSKEASFHLKVEAYEDKPGTTQKVTYKNIVSESNVSSNLNTTAFPDYSDVQRLKSPSLMPSLLQTFFGAALGSFFGYSKEEASPSTALTKIDFSFPDSPENIRKIRIIMGSRGIPERLDVNGSTVWSSGSVPSPSKALLGNSHRVYQHDFSSPATVSNMSLYIRPDKWFVRPVYNVVWFIFKFSFFLYNAYRSGFNVDAVEIIQEKIIPGTTPWSTEGEMQGVTLRHFPYKASLREIVKQLGIEPPAGKDLSSVKYRISLINPDHRTSLQVTSRGKVALEQDGAVVISHQDLGSTYVEIQNPDYDLVSSPRFSLITTNTGNIVAMPPAEVETDEAWGLRINNGRFQVRDFIAGYARDYFIPEFGAQAFDPTIPYRKARNESPVYETRRRLRLRNAPLRVLTDSEGNPTNLQIRRGGELLEIADWNAATGQVYLRTRIEFTDVLEADYEYEMTYLEYRGFFDGQDFYHLDLCPHPGRTYTDLSDPEVERDTSELLEKDIYVYCIPVYERMLAIDEPAPPVEGEVAHVHQGGSIRHIIVDEDTPESQVVSQIQGVHPAALLLAKAQVRRSHLPESIVQVDSRRRGGGISAILTDEEALRIYPQAEAFWDFGHYEGRPYPSNSVLIVSLPESVKDNVHEEEIRRFLERTVDMGVYPYLRFVPSDTNNG